MTACYDYNICGHNIFNHYVPDEQLPIAYRTNSSMKDVPLPESHVRLQRAIVKVATEIFGHFDKNQSMSLPNIEMEKSPKISANPDWIRVHQDLRNFQRICKSDQEKLRSSPKAIYFRTAFGLLGLYRFPLRFFQKKCTREELLSNSKIIIKTKTPAKNPLPSPKAITNFLDKLSQKSPTT